MRSSHIARYLLAVSLSFLSITSWSVTDGYEIPELNYIQIENGIEITGCVEACPLWMEIPESIDGYDVIVIGESAFKSSGIERVIIPDTVTLIDSMAFEQAGLRRLKLGNNVSIIEFRAFKSNPLVDLFIPASVSRIEYQAFTGGDNVFFYGDRPFIYSTYSGGSNFENSTNYFYCAGKNGWPGDPIRTQAPDNLPQLDEICDSDYFPPEFTYEAYEDGIEIINCMYNHCQEDIIIPSEIDGQIVRSISNSFGYRASNSNPKSITLPETLINISDRAFVHLKLETITIPENVQSVGKSAFHNNNLIEVNVSNNFDAAMLGAFSLNPGKSHGGFRYLEINNELMILGCDGQCPADLVIPNDVLGTEVSAIAADAFKNSGLSSVTLPDTVKYLFEYSFHGNNLTTVTTPSQLKIIEWGAFGNNQIAELNMPSVEIMNGGFDANNLKTVSLPSNLAYISGQSFNDNNLIAVTFLGNRPEINTDGFYIGIFKANDDLRAIMYCPKTSNWPGDDIPLEWYDSDIGGYATIKPVLAKTCDSDGDGITNSFDSSPFLSNQSAQIDESYSFWDIDKNGSVGALTDGLILLRYFFGLRGEGLINGAIDSNGLRTSSTDIEAYIESHMP